MRMSSDEINALFEHSNNFHDCIVDSLNVHYMLRRSHLIAVWSMLPFHVQMIAREHGLNDTVFRDQVFTFIQENKVVITSKLVSMGEVTK